MRPDEVKGVCAWSKRHGREFSQSTWGYEEEKLGLLIGSFTRIDGNHRVRLRTGTGAAGDMQDFENKGLKNNEKSSRYKSGMTSMHS